MTKLDTLSLLTALLTACGSSSNATDAGSIADAHGPDAHPAANNAIPLSTPNGSYYTANVSIGSQMFVLDIDTGSTTTGVAASGCTTCANVGITDLYSPGSTATTANRAVHTSYGDGSTWSGTIYTDQVGLGHGTPNVSLNFGAISTQTNFFHDASHEGILGLGTPQLLEPGTTSYFAAEATAGVTPELAFELCDDHGTMWVGDYDPFAASGTVQYTSMQQSGQAPFYGVAPSDMGIGGVSLGFDNSTFQTPIVDTGTSLIYLPSTVITALTASVSASPGFQALFPNQTLSATDNSGCVMAKVGTLYSDVNAMLPKLSLTFPTADNTSTFTVNLNAAESYLALGGNEMYCLDIFDDSANGPIFGDAMLRGMVTVIDVANSQVGFAPDQGCTAGATDRTRATAAHRPVEMGHRRPR